MFGMFGLAMPVAIIKYLQDLRNKIVKNKESVKVKPWGGG